MNCPDWCDKETWARAVLVMRGDAPESAFWERNGNNALPMISRCARALLSAKREGMETMKPLVERAFRDGLTYGSICDVADQDEAWRTSSVRQKAQEIGK